MKRSVKDQSSKTLSDSITYRKRHNRTTGSVSKRTNSQAKEQLRIARLMISELTSKLSKMSIDNETISPPASPSLRSKSPNININLRETHGSAAADNQDDNPREKTGQVASQLTSDAGSSTSRTQEKKQWTKKGPRSRRSDDKGSQGFRPCEYYNNNICVRGTECQYHHMYENITLPRLAMQIDAILTYVKRIDSELKDLKIATSDNHSKRYHRASHSDHSRSRRAYRDDSSDDYLSDRSNCPKGKDKMSSSRDDGRINKRDFSRNRSTSRVDTSIVRSQTAKTNERLMQASNRGKSQRSCSNDRGSGQDKRRSAKKKDGLDLLLSRGRRT